jgi:hypothetical protein
LRNSLPTIQDLDDDKLDDLFKEIMIMSILSGGVDIEEHGSNHEKDGQ